MMMERVPTPTPVTPSNEEILTITESYEPEYIPGTAAGSPLPPAPLSAPIHSTTTPRILIGFPDDTDYEPLPNRREEDRAWSIPPVAVSMPVTARSARPTTANGLLSTERYAAIDRHVHHTPVWAEKNMEGLIQYLNAAARAPIDRARGIFVWITTRVSHETHNDVAPASLKAEKVFASRRATCDGYAALFQKLSTVCGLEAVTIRGDSNGYGYVTGQSMEWRMGPDGISAKHAWNAVKLDGKWRLVDCTWGSGSFDEEGMWSTRFNSHYFATAANEFKSDHIPEKQSWQLLQQPISREDHDRSPLVRPGYWRHRLKMWSHTEGTITCRRSIVAAFLSPPDTRITAELLLPSDPAPLSRNLTLSQSEGNQTRIRVVFPAPASYILRIFAKSEWALDYRVMAEERMMGPFAFPTPLGPFVTSKAILLAPLGGFLCKGARYSFKIVVPRAEAVVVAAGDYGRQPLSQSLEPDLFEGVIDIGTGRVEVHALFPGTNRFTCLLQYPVAPGGS